MKLKALVGSGDNIMLLTLPFLLLGFILNMRMPSTFTVGGPSPFLKVVSIVVLVPGVAVGIVLYVASRLFSPEEEKELSKAFGTAWDDYCREVKIPWL